MMALTALAATALLTSQETPFTRDLLPVGHQVSAISIQSTKGTMDYKPGTPAVIGFWHLGTREAGPLLTQLNGLKEKHDKKLRVMPIAVNDPKDRVLEFLKSKDLDLEVGLGDDVMKSMYGVKGYPTVYVLDKTGKVAFRDHKPDAAALNSAIEAVLK